MSNEEIELLKKENAYLKSLVLEGKKQFTFIDETLGLKKAAESNYFVAKVATMITKVQRNPEIFKNLMAYFEKINNLKLE